MSEFVEQSRPKHTYFDYKAGKCTDLEYMQSAYGGKVTKHFVKRDPHHNHPFFLIVREINEGFHHYYEVKVYDFDRGLINKERVYEPITNEEYWNGNDDVLGFKDNQEFKSYVQFLCDTNQINVSLKKKRSK